MRSLLSQFLIFTILLSLVLPLSSQNLVSGDSVVGGSSVFVFPKGSKAAQSRSRGGRMMASYASGGVGGGGGLGGGALRTAKVTPKRRPAATQSTVKPSRTATAAARNRVKVNTLLTNGERNLQDGKTDASIADFRAARAIDAKNKRAMDGLSDALTIKSMDEIQAKELGKARASLDEAIKLDPQNDLAYARLGAVYEAEDNGALALTNYEKAVTINPQNTYLFEPLAVASYENGDLVKTETYLKRAETAGVGSTETKFLQGAILYKKDDFESAVVQFDKAIASDGSHSMSHYYRGLSLEKLGSGTQAIDSIKKAVELDPGNADANYDLGVILYNSGDFAMAATAYENVVRTRPLYYEANANLGSTYRQLERYSDAVEAFKAAEPGYKKPEMYTDWGYCLGKIKEWETSAQKLETAAELSPSAPEKSNVGWAYINGAELDKAEKRDDQANGKMEKARNILKAAVEINPNFDAALLNLGTSNNFLGDFAEAVRVLDLALSIRKDWTIALTQIGYGYRGVGDLTRSVTAFKRVVDLEPKASTALFNLGEAYHIAGNKKEAKKIRGQLAKLDPTLASQLDNVLAGRAIDAVRQNIETKIPKPRLPF